MRKIMSTAFVVLMFFLMLCNADNVKATSKTANEAISWVSSKVGQSIDADGAYGYQCVDLIKAYYSYLGVSPVRGNGCDYATNSLPSGWSRIKGAQPQKGDILVYTGGYGHVAIYESDYVTYHQNYNGKTSVSRETFAYNSPSYITNYTPYWGVIRPNWSSGYNGSGTPDISNQTPNLLRKGMSISVTFQAVSNAKYYDVVWCGTDGVPMDYRNIGTGTSTTISVANEGTYYVYINAFGADGNYTTSNRSMICVQGDRLNIDSMVPFATMIKSDAGYYLYADLEEGVLKKKSSIDYSHLNNYYFTFERFNESNDYILRSYTDAKVVTYAGNYYENFFCFALKKFDANAINKIVVKERKGTNTYMLFLSGSAYFVLDTGNTVNDKIYSYLCANVNNTNQNFQFIKLDLDIKGYVGEYDSKWHSLALGNENAAVQYKTSPDAEWSTTKPVFKEPGVHTVYYQVIDPRYYAKTGSVQIKISQLSQSIRNVTQEEKRVTNSSAKNINTGITLVVKNKKGKKVNAKWEKVKSVKGYQLQYATNKKFKKKKSVYTKKTKYALKKLKKKKTYYIRVRAYRYKGKKKVYGKWSGVKKVKIKK